MEHDSDTNPAHAGPAAHPIPGARWTPSKQRIFLAALAETGNVAHAARAADMSRSSAHGLRKRLAGTRFDQLWAHALRVHASRLADPFGPAAVAPASPARRPPVAGETRG